MIRLNPKIRASRSYNPPVLVIRYYEDVDTSLPLAEQLEQLLWIPALLVSRYLAQFPFLENESDEMFSVGMLRVAELIDENKFSGSKIAFAAFPRCNYAIESYVNNLDSIVKVSTSTRYNNLRNGKDTPSHQRLVTDQVVHDDHSQLLVADACQVLGYDPSNLSLKQKKRLASILLDFEK